MDIRLPQLGEGADSGVVVSILVKEGDRLQPEQPIIELETEKAVGAIPAPQAGLVTRIHTKVGDTLSVGGLILSLAAAGAAGASAQKPETTAPARATAAAVAPAAPATPAGPVAAPAAAGPGLAPPAAPSIRKLAAELGIDLRRVTGREAGGRIVLEDLRAYVRRLQELAFPAAAAPPVAAAPAREAIDFSQWGPVLKKPLTGIRRTISRRLHESWTAIPHVTQFEEADITALLELQRKYRAAYEANGAHLTLTGMVLKALVAVLAQYPIFNASLDEDSEEIVYKQYYHLGVAVDTEHGLLAPVIRDVDKKSLLEVARELERLAEKARQRQITAAELKGGSFTVSNQGGIGGGPFTPIINRPEVAVLGLGRGAWRAVVVEGKIAPRLLLPLCLSYDHRLIDGADAARFVVSLRQALENFSEETVRV